MITFLKINIGDTREGNMSRNSFLSGYSDLTSRQSSALTKADDGGCRDAKSSRSLKSAEIDEEEERLAEIEFNKHVEAIISTLTQTVYQVVSWALFVEHKLIFSFSICVNILKHDNPEQISQWISGVDYNFFLNSSLLADMKLEQLTEQIQEFKEMEFSKELLIDDKTLRQLIILEELLPDKFKDLCLNIETNIDFVWRKFMNSNDPYDFSDIEGRTFRLV